MEHFTDIGQSIEEGLERQKRELQESGFIPDISSDGYFTLKDRSGQTVLEGELINKQLVFSQLQVTEDIKELAKDYFISTIAQEHIAKENEKYKVNNLLELKNETTETKEMTQAEKDSKFLLENYGNKKLVDAAVKKASISDFVSTDKSRLFMNGIFYEKGFAVATDGRMLIKLKKNYPSEWEGKIIDPNTEKEIEGQFPPYERIFPNKELLKDRSDRLAHISHYLSEATAAIAISEKTKRVEKIVPVMFDNTFVNPRHLQLALSFARDKDFNKVLQADNYKIDHEPVLDENGKEVYKYYKVDERSEDNLAHKYYTLDELPEDVKKAAYEKIELVGLDNPTNINVKNGELWSYDKVEEKKIIYETNLEKPLSSVIEFDAPDGSSILIMPAGEPEGPYIDKDGILKNYEDITFIKTKLLGKDEELHKNIVRTLINESDFSDVDVDSIYKKNLEKALAKLNPDVFPKNKKDCQILATVTTYTDVIGENLDRKDFIFEQGQNTATLQQFVYNLWLERFKDYSAHPEHLFVTGEDLNPKNTLKMAAEKNIIKEKELDFEQLVQNEFGDALKAQEHIVKENEKIIEEGIESMQVNGGRSDAAMEADYEYEQFSSPEMEETEEESFGFENFTAEDLLHLAEISPEAYESLKKEYEQRTGLSADEYLKKAGDKDRQEKKESLISQRLKSLLEAQEMTIQELAIKAGVTEAAMLRYINGERIPRGAILLNVANAFGVSVEQITGKEFPFTVGEQIPLDTFTSSYGGENWIIEKINENNVQLGRSTDNIIIQHEGKVMSKEDFLEAVQSIHPELVNTVVEKNPPEQKPDIATSFVLESDNLDAKKPETIGDIDVETLRKALQTALEETAEELPYTPFTRENYNALFPYSKVETPLGAVKLGAHQFEKLEQKDRQYILQAVHDTLADPSIVIKETGKDVFGEDKISNIFAKSYIFPSDKVRAIQSVVVSIDGENISITSHQRDISNVVNKIKKPDQLLFAAARVRLLVERMDKPVTVNPTSESGYAESLNDSIREDLQKVNKYETQFFSQSFNLEGKTSTEKVKEITEKLKTGVNEIFESGQYEQYLKVMSKFHDYSTNNTILIALQRPDATRVAGFTTWKNEFQRSVKKGEKGIKILAPMFFKKEPQEKDVPDSETHSSENHEQEENEEQIITRFKVVNVFDICQTEGKELPRIGVDALKGDIEHYEAFYHSLEKTSPVPMAFEAIEGASRGYYDLVNKRIAIKAGLSQLQTIKTAIHEIAHATLHADKNSNTDRSTAEVQAESIAYTVCSYYGLDTSDQSFGYVAGWSRGKEIKELKDSLEIIRKTSSQIITDIDKHFSQIQEKQVIKEKQKTAFAQLELFSREELSNTPSIRKLMIDQALSREHITAGKAALRKYSESVLSGKQEGLWKSFYKFKTKGVFDIVGSKITLNKEGTLTDTSWNQLHTALKIYRDKRFETFRYLFVDNKGMIKDQLTLCSYLPNRTVATLPGKNIIPNIIKHAEETQTRIILAHNHPSGSTSPSFEDVLTTQKLKRIFTNSRGKSLLLGHIILDHDTAEIYDNSKANWYTIQTNKTNKDPLTKNDPLAKTELYSSLLLNSVCRQINETDTWKAKGFVPLVFVSGDKKVSAIKMYPESFFAGSQEDVLKELQHIGSQTGSNWCFPIVQNRKDISQNCTKNIRRLFEKKCFMDYMIEKEIGTELNSSYGGGIFDAISAEERQKRIKIESTFCLDKNNNTIATNTGVLICNEENEVKENTLPEKLFTTKEIKSGQSHTGILKESYLVSQNFFPPMTEKDGTISIYCSSKDLNMPVYALNPNEPVKVNMTKKQVAVLLDTAIKTHILKVKNTKDFKIILPEKSNPNPDFAKMLMSVTPGISYEGIKKEYNKIFNSVSKEMNALRIQVCKSQSPSRPLPPKRVYSGGMEY